MGDGNEDPGSVAQQSGAFGFALPTGSYEDALDWVGRTREIQFAEVPVNEAMIKVYAAMVEDGNASYWDEEIARRTWGSVISPPAMLHVWMMPLQWAPYGVQPPVPLGSLVPLPGSGLINVSTDTVFNAPMRMGARLNMVEEVIAISPEKATRLGQGHFVKTLGLYRDETGQILGEHTNTLLRYQTDGQ